MRLFNDKEDLIDTILETLEEYDDENLLGGEGHSEGHEAGADAAESHNENAATHKEGNAHNNNAASSVSSSQGSSQSATKKEKKEKKSKKNNNNPEAFFD